MALFICCFRYLAFTSLLCMVDIQSIDWDCLTQLYYKGENVGCWTRTDAAGKIPDTVLWATLKILNHLIRKVPYLSPVYIHVYVKLNPHLLDRVASFAEVGPLLLLCSHSAIEIYIAQSKCGLNTINVILRGYTTWLAWANLPQGTNVQCYLQLKSIAC